MIAHQHANSIQSVDENGMEYFKKHVTGQAKVFPCRADKN